MHFQPKLQPGSFTHLTTQCALPISHELEATTAKNRRGQPVDGIRLCAHKAPFATKLQAAYNQAACSRLSAERQLQPRQ